MKKFLTYFLSASLLLVSCSDDFTDINPVGALSDASLQNATGVDLLLVGAYSMLDGIRQGHGDDWHVSGDNWWLDVLSDDAHKGSTDGDQADLLALELYTWDTTNPYIYNNWRAVFAGINRSNSVINLINTSEDPSLFTVEMAQARFLRGHFNFELQKKWVNVPYISDENFAASEFNQPNSGPIWSQIEADFAYAAANLPTSRGGDYAEPGRPIKSTALSYHGKALLHQNKWSEALTSLESAINSGDYSLALDYFSNWRSDGENGPGMVFAIQYASDGGQSFQGNRGGTLNMPIGPMTGGLCCGFYQPTQNLANAFQTDSNGLPLANWASSDIANDAGIESSDAFTPHTGNLDPRIDYTIARRGVDFNGFGVFTGKENIRASFTDISGPYMTKKNFYTSGDDSNRGTGGWGEQRTGINYHIIRYADVLLMAAEAAAESGNLEKARGYVNQVRSRAKNSPTADSGPNYVIDTYNSAWTDASAARSAVRHERRIELGMEGHRLFDLRRWGNMVETLNTYIGHEGRTIPPFASRVNTVSSKHNTLPIPLNAIDSSEGALSQNPGH
ncbi:MAG: RagB/SusD family nutrient uptake outer membrane protein [Flavobacteriales bacterium]|nr:RagB/SusD family nutrient uptake outer membrane protein [Flavobacteriales bacterium]